ncbi:MAG TPA: hypothetical protein ENG86_08420 [Nitrospirae bacterium]|nr:hypothetical protein [Nitrospirota bacterium]
MPGTGAKSLMKDAKTLWFPVVVSGETQTKLEMVEKKGKWIPGEFGGLGPVQKVVANQKQLPELLEPIKTGAPYTLKLLKIPELYAVFLYVEGLQKEYLIPAMVQPQRFQLKNGKLYTADEVLSKLSEYAKKIAPDKVI